MTTLVQQPVFDDEPDVRMCALTRTQRSREELLRFVASPDGTVVPDLRQNLPGRGVWVTLSRRDIVEAARRNVFARALKKEVRLPEDLAGLVARLLLKDAMSVCHWHPRQVRWWPDLRRPKSTLRHGRAAVLVSASDGAADGRRKLSGILRAADQAGHLVECFASADLDLALGRTNVIHAAINPGGLARKFLTCARRYEFFEFNGAARAES